MKEHNPNELRFSIALYVVLWLVASTMSFIGGIAWERWHAAASQKDIVMVED